MTIEIRNPAAPDEIVATYAETPLDTLDDLMSRARGAQKVWATTPQPTRGALVAEFVDALEARGEDIQCPSPRRWANRWPRRAVRLPKQ